MTQQIIRAPLFDPPTTTPRKGSLLEAATVHDGMAWLGPQDAFASYNCLDMQALGAFCFNGNATPSGATKDLDVAPQWITPDQPFGVYGGITCRPFGFSGGLAALEKSFITNEGIGVEKALMQYFTHIGSSGMNVLDPKGGGTTVDPALGVAALEDDASAHYGGVPTIHMPRGVASVLSNTQVQFEGNAMFTHLGSKVAAGGGYGNPNLDPDGAAAADGERWLYATGEVVLWRGELVSQEAFDTNTNDMVALVERTYMLAIDCYVAAVKVSVE